MQPTHKYLSNLTPLRGIAALWVVVFHFSEIVVTFVPKNETLLLTKGYLMVDLFFIMSGFIISHVYLQNFQSAVSATNFRNFIVARFARIYPLHFFTLLVLVLLALQRGTWFPLQTPASIPTNVFLLHSFGIHKIFTWNVPSWSISAEWWAYMVFPLLSIFIYRKKKPAIIILTLFVVIAYLSIMFWIPRTNLFAPGEPPRKNLDVTFDYGFLRGLAGFITGMLLYKMYEANIFRKIVRRDSVALIIGLGIIYSMHAGWNDGIDILLFAALILAFAWNSGRIHVISNNRVAQYLGKISYSIYLVQLFPLIPIFSGAKLPGLIYHDRGATASFWTGTAYCLIYLALVTGLSTLTYFGIEKPCRKFLNRRFGKETLPVYA